MPVLRFPSRKSTGKPLAARLSDLAKRTRAFGQGLHFVARLLFDAAPRFALLLVLFTLLQAALPVLNVRLAQILVNALASGQPVSLFLPFLLLYLALHLAAATLTPGLNALQALVNERLVGRVTTLVLTRVNAFPDLTRFEDPKLHDELRLIGERAPHLSRNLLRAATQVGQILLTALALGVLLASLHPLAPVILIGAAIPAALVQRRSMLLAYGQYPEIVAWDRRRWYWLEVGTGAREAREVQLLGITGWVREQFAACQREVDERRWRLRHRVLGEALAALGLRYLGTVAVFGYLLSRGVSGEVRPGDFVLFMGSFLLLDRQLRFMPTFVAHLVESGLVADRFLAFLGADPANDERPATNDQRRTTDTGPRWSLVVRRWSSGIVLERVSFQYPGRDEPVLRDVSFGIRPGETVALVGRNGAGKTTLVKLLTALYRPTGGRILVEGHDLSEVDPAALRDRIAVVFQDYGRYFLTAGENIGLGRVEAMAETERIARAAEAGGAAPLIQRLPDGYATALGKEFGGTDLSGGEWQKLALSRAFMRDADLLILDEPTAALDARAEAALYERFRMLLGGRMGLLISHRFSTVRMADRIVVLDAGRIVEEGSHEELIERGGLYPEMFRMQAAAFVSPSDPRVGGGEEEAR